MAQKTGALIFDETADPVSYTHLLSVFLKPPRSCLDGVCILVDADETAFGAQPL